MLRYVALTEMYAPAAPLCQHSTQICRTALPAPSASRALPQYTYIYVTTDDASLLDSTTQPCAVYMALRAEATPAPAACPAEALAGLATQAVLLGGVAL